MQKDSEIRSCELLAELTNENKNEVRMILEGTPIIFEQLTRIKNPSGDFFEIIEKEALRSCDLSNIPLIYNHSQNAVPLAKSPDTMHFEIRDNGLYMTAELANTESARAIYEAVKRRDLSGMSFAFRIAPNGDSYDARSNTRTIKKIDKIFECSIVIFPAYTGTNIEARNAIEAARINYKERQRAKILINQIRKVRI